MIELRVVIVSQAPQLKRNTDGTSLLDSVDIDESLIDFILAPHHLLCKQVEVFDLQVIKFIVRACGLAHITV